ncbi:MAG TPA: hypothetical protein VGI10_30585 [Polyangiaceae bacterium]|jgi:hypothetical protein
MAHDLACRENPPSRNRARRWSPLGGLVLVALACSGVVTSEQGSGGGGAATHGGSPAGGSPSVMRVPDAGGGIRNVGGAGGTSGTAGSGGVHLGGGLPICESPTLDPSAQLVVCANGFEHRAQALACGPPLVDEGSGGAPAEGGAGAGEVGIGPGRFTECVENSDCAPPSLTDSEPGFACLCAPNLFDHGFPVGWRGACLPANCKTDADCGGGFCALGTVDFSGDPILGWVCLSADDECTIDADCDPGKMCWSLLGSPQPPRRCSLPPE